MFVTSNRMPPNRGSRSLDGVSKLGKIRSVYCKDFVTYSECVFHPTEYLNVIIGPNGTGKSTLVSAIVLGLGGDPKILARSSSIGDYVKNGCDSAKVVVEIHGEGDETTKFQRSFDLQGKSHFAVDEHGVTQKKFLESVDIFKIQIGNLCQFLPQDRVQDFAKMNPQQILANTINSICGQDIVDNFQKLKELRNEQANGKSGYKNLVQKLEETMHRVEDKKTSEVYFCATCYNVHKWKICCDLKVVNIIQGIILKGGFPKYFCFLCNWDSRYTGNQYECKDWKAKTPELEKQLKLRNKPLIKDLDDILLPPLHMKLGIAGKFVEVVVKGIEDAYDCLKSIFPKLSEAKIRNGILNGPDIRKLMKSESFTNVLSNLITTYVHGTH